MVSIQTHDLNFGVQLFHHSFEPSDGVKCLSSQAANKQGASERCASRIYYQIPLSLQLQFIQILMSMK